MLKQTIQYKDFDDNNVQEDFYFNFTMLEIIEQVEIHNIQKRIEKLTTTEDGPGAYYLFKDLVLDSYGVKSIDGKKFDKTPEIRHDFEASAAISALIISFLQNAELGIAFVKGVLPQEMLDVAVAEVAAKEQAVRGVHVPPAAQPVTPTPLRSMPTTTLDKQELAGGTAASTERVDGATPTDTGIEMSTSEKRMYSQEELDAVQGVPGTVPVAPETSTKEYTDAEVLAMDPQLLQTRGLLMRAFQLKNAAQ